MTRTSEHSRVWYRRQQDGQRGWRLNDTTIRLDRDGQKIDVPLTRDWLPERHERPLNGYQVAIISFLADRQLCKNLGILCKRTEWLNMLDEERIEWRDVGPLDHPLREQLYQAIKSALVEASVP